MNLNSLRSAGALAVAGLVLSAAPALASTTDGTSNTLQSGYVFENIMIESVIAPPKAPHSFQGGCAKYSDDAC